MRITYAIILLVLCTWLGLAAGELALYFIPADTAAHTILARTFSTPELTMPATDLVVLLFGATIQLRITAAGLLGTIVGAVLSFFVI